MWSLNHGSLEELEGLCCLLSCKIAWLKTEASCQIK